MVIWGTGMKDRKSKLKSVNTKDPVEFREHLDKFNKILRTAGNELSEQEIDRMIELHCEEGLSPEECVERMMQE